MDIDANRIEAHITRILKSRSWRAEAIAAIRTHCGTDVINELGRTLCRWFTNRIDATANNADARDFIGSLVSAAIDAFDFEGAAFDEVRAIEHEIAEKAGAGVATPMAFRVTNQAINDAVQSAIDDGDEYDSAADYAGPAREAYNRAKQILKEIK